MAIAAGNPRFEFEPAFGNAARFGGGLPGVLHKVGRFGCGKLAGKHVADLLAAFEGLQVPGKGHQISPVAIRLKQVGGGVHVAFRQRSFELRKGRVDLGSGADIEHLFSSMIAW